ncbi:microtubule-associated tumor suppressor candidate 2-like [Tachypleus tridentatus]|uniref:microtubule-associated tumor suppressor candidate 2-like n=1 Tax=Tachypleus tridentatus TaxID=6853 RepID=UPI003FD14E79
MSRTKTFKKVASLKELHNREIEELKNGFAKQMQQASESHEKALDILKQQLQDLQKQMESNLRTDTDTKLQRILDQNWYLEQEVESFKTVLEFKVGDVHRLRKENLEMQEELNELPSARKEIQKLKARNEDLQAMLDEKVRIERQLRSESLQLKEEFQKEVKSKSRLSMENEELQWRLKQAMESPNERPDVPEVEESAEEKE